MSALLLAILMAFSTPCAAEDSLNCYWDAPSQGNGLGTSFININDTIIYLEG